MYPGEKARNNLGTALKTLVLIALQGKEQRPYTYMTVFELK